MVKVDRLKNVILCLEAGSFRADQNNTDLQVLTGCMGLSLEHGLSRSSGPMVQDSAPNLACDLFLDWICSIGFEHLTRRGFKETRYSCFCDF